MSSAGDPAKLLGDEVAAHRAAADRDQGDQLGLELGDEEREAIDELEDLADSEDHLPLPDAREVLAIQAELDCDIYRAVREHQRRQGKGGRKPGSGNRRNQDFRKFMLSMGPHPGAVLARLMGRSPAQLAAELGCSKEKAADKLIRIAVETLPYMESKMPALAKVAVAGDFQLAIAPGTGLFDEIEDADFEDVPELDFAAEETEQKQASSADDIKASE